MAEGFFRFTWKRGVFDCIEYWLVPIKAQKRTHIDGGTKEHGQGNDVSSQDETNVLEAEEPTARWTSRAIHCDIGATGSDIQMNFDVACAAR